MLNAENVVKDPRKPTMINVATCGAIILFSLILQTIPIKALPTIFTEKVDKGKEELMEFNIACDNNHLDAAPKAPPNIISPRVVITELSTMLLLKSHRFVSGVYYDFTEKISRLHRVIRFRTLTESERWSNYAFQFLGINKVHNGSKF